MSAPLTEAQIKNIYRATIDSLYGYVSRKCGGERELAEDVTQEVWLRAIREWQRTGAPDSPIAWLTTVARNLILNHHKKRKDVPMDASYAETILAAIEDDSVSDSEEVAAVMSRALAQLPPAESQLLEAFHYERKGMAQLATIFGVTDRAIEGRLRRAREHLRGILLRATISEGSTT